MSLRTGEQIMSGRVMNAHTYEGVKRSIRKGNALFAPSNGVEVWSSACTLKEFGEATQLWLEGGIRYMPTRSYERYPNEETMSLIPYLRPLNRSGTLVSNFSQPACTLNQRPQFGAIMDEQRAAVSGFMQDEEVDLLRTLIKNDGEIVLLATPPGSPSAENHVVISKDNGKAITLTGNTYGADEIAEDYTGLNPAMIVKLQHCFQVHLYDQEWGSNDRLWSLLERFSQLDRKNHD